MRAINCIPNVPNGSVMVMARDMGQAMRTLGLDVIDMEYRSGEKVPRQMPRLLDWVSKSPDGGLLVDINGRVATSDLVARASRERPGTFRCFTFLTDTPLHFNDRLRKWPLGAIVGFVDRSFPDLVDFMGYNRPNYLFFPHGGPIATPSRTTSQREIDILFIGNVAKVDPPEIHASRLYGENRDLIGLFTSSFEAIEPSRTPFETVRATATALHDAFTADNIAIVASHIELYVSNASRSKTLASLAPRDVTVVGAIADGVLDSDRHVRPLGFRPYAQCIELMSRSKVLINIVPSFPNGGHERVFYAMSQGVGVMTTRSTFLEPDADTHGFVDFFDVARDDVSIRLGHFLADLEDNRRDRDEMLRYYNCHHTWERRLTPLVTQTRELFA